MLQRVRKSATSRCERYLNPDPPGAAAPRPGLAPLFALAADEDQQETRMKIAAPLENRTLVSWPNLGPTVIKNKNIESPSPVV